MRKEEGYAVSATYIADLKRRKQKQILKADRSISPGMMAIVLGDVSLTSRGGGTPSEYIIIALASLQGKCSWIRGATDDWLANYTYKVHNTRRKTACLWLVYNSLNCCDSVLQKYAGTLRTVICVISGLPLQKELELEEKKYLFAHAAHDFRMSGKETILHAGDDDGCELPFSNFEGIDGYISMCVCGHTPTDACVEEGQKISGRAGQFHRLVQRRHNVYLLDCRCGFAGGRLLPLPLSGRRVKKRFTLT